MVHKIGYYSHRIKYHFSDLLLFSKSLVKPILEQQNEKLWSGSIKKELKQL